TDFTLASGGYFVVVHFNIETHLSHGIAHGGAKIVEGVDRGNREIAALDAGAVTHVAVGKGVAGRPGRFFRADFDKAAAHVVTPFDVVKDKKFGFGAKESRIAEAGGLQIVFGAAGNGTGVA